MQDVKFTKIIRLVFQVHTNEKPFPCTGCNLKFKTLGQVKRHREVKRCGFDEQELFKTKSPTKDIL